MLRQSVAKMTTPLAEVPSISRLYRSKHLLPASQPGADLPAPCQAFNDKIAIVRGDITKIQADAIVNAGNKSLLGGGGVDGAIHRAAGPGLLAECRPLGGCETGEAKATNAYALPCKKVIHTVGPVYRSSGREKSERLLHNCYTNSLGVAVEQNCKSVIFSCLSTGVYGYPSEGAAWTALRAVRGFLEGEQGGNISKVVFCTFESKDVDAYADVIP